MNTTTYLERIDVNKSNLTINKQNAKLKHFEIAFRANVLLGIAERTLDKVEDSFKDFETGKSNTQTLRKNLTEQVENLCSYKAELQACVEELKELSVQLQALNTIATAIENIENFLS